MGQISLSGLTGTYVTLIYTNTNQDTLKWCTHSNTYVVVPVTGLLQVVVVLGWYRRMEASEWRAEIKYRW